MLISGSSVQIDKQTSKESDGTNKADETANHHSENYYQKIYFFFKCIEGICLNALNALYNTFKSCFLLFNFTCCMT